MSKGFFTDKNLKPTDSDILKIIGSAKSNWDLILLHLRSDLKCNGDFKFYGINYGWAMRFKKNGRSIVALYPEKDGFTVQVILNSNQVDSALLTDLDVNIIKIIEDTKTIHEGRWIYLKINSRTDIKDVLKIIGIRIK